MPRRNPATTARMDAVLAVLRDAAGEPVSAMAITDFTGEGNRGYVSTYRALCHLERDGLARRATYAERCRPVTLPDGRPYEFPPDPREVQEVVEMPLDAIVDGTAALHEARLFEDGSVLRRMSFAHGGYLVFGATAWILGDLARIIAGAGLTPRDLSQGRPDQETTQ